MRPDDLDAIFDGALFGPNEQEVPPEAVAPHAEVVAPVPVGAMDWYMDRNSQPMGPFRLERLRELWHAGEFGPDTLFWCEAWNTWRPLSRIPELVAAMTISGLPTVTADMSATSAPPRSKGTASEKKTVSTLHSLVAEEEVWLRKQEDKKEQEKEEARSASIDAPVSVPTPAPVQAPAPTPVPVAQPVPPMVAQAPAPYPAPYAAPYAAPYSGVGGPVAPPVAPPMMAVPMAPEAFAPSRPGKTFLVGALIGSTVVGLIVGGLVLVSQGRRSPETVSEAPQRSIVAPEVASQPGAPVGAQPTAPAPQPVAVAAPAVQPAAPAPQPAVVATPTPEKQVAKVVPAPTRPEKPRPVAEATPVQRRSPPPAPASSRAPANEPTSVDDAFDKEFEEELGFSKGSSKQNARALPESLSTSDVVQVVGSHKAAILSCIETHEPPQSDSGRNRFVVRWRVLPTGNATEVAMETESLKGTSFARCIEGQVRSWKFPQHRVQSREPIRFPFTY